MTLWKACYGVFASFLGVQADGSFWMPPQASTVSPQVDWLFDLIFWIALFFFILIAGLLTLFVFLYRRREGHRPGPAPDHSMPLEITWTVIPLLLGILIFYLGFGIFMDMSTPPANAYEVLVTGQRWKWLFTYPNGYVDENLHVPVDRPVRLVMSSEDVIHSLFIPDFRVKMDVVPGRYTKTWFQATRTGDFLLTCAEYCGTSHSDMSALVVVHEPGGFEVWLEKASNFLDTMSPAEAGEKLYKRSGCSQCHSVDGKSGTGPTFLGLYGSSQPVRGGGTVVVDENYVRESILDPQASVVAGFDPVMPTYRGRLKDREISAIIEFLKTRGK